MYLIEKYQNSCLYKFYPSPSVMYKTTTKTNILRKLNKTDITRLMILEEEKRHATSYNNMTPQKPQNTVK